MDPNQSLINLGYTVENKYQIQNHPTMSIYKDLTNLTNPNAFYYQEELNCKRYNTQYVVYLAQRKTFQTSP